MKAQRVPILAWITLTVVLVAIVIIVAVSSSPDRGRCEAVRLQPVLPVWECEFSTKDSTLTVGKKCVTAWFGQGMRRDIWANKAFFAFSTKPNGAVVDSFLMPEGRSSFCAALHSSGNLEVRPDSGTVLKFGSEY